MEKGTLAFFAVFWYHIYMSIYDLLKKRISVRKYLPGGVEIEVIRRIMEGVNISPSARNLQPWHFIVITDQKLKDDLFPDRKWAAEAPYVVVACGDESQAWVRPTDGKNHVDIDIAIAMENLVLLATEEGLGSCWICYFDPDAVTRVLDLPKNLKPIAMTPLGIPAINEDKPHVRKELSDIVEWR